MAFCAACGKQVGSRVGCRCRPKPANFPIRAGGRWIDPGTGELLGSTPAPAPAEPEQLALPDDDQLRLADYLAQLRATATEARERSPWRRAGAKSARPAQ